MNVGRYFHEKVAEFMMYSQKYTTCISEILFDVSQYLIASPEKVLLTCNFNSTEGNGVANELCLGLARILNL